MAVLTQLGGLGANLQVPHLHVPDLQNFKQQVSDLQDWDVHGWNLHRAALLAVRHGVPLGLLLFAGNRGKRQLTNALSHRVTEAAQVRGPRIRELSRSLEVLDSTTGTYGPTGPDSGRIQMVVAVVGESTGKTLGGRDPLCSVTALLAMGGAELIRARSADMADAVVLGLDLAEPGATTVPRFDSSTWCETGDLSRKYLAAQVDELLALLPTLPPDVPRLALISLGANDIILKTDLMAVEAATEYQVGRLAAAGFDVVMAPAPDLGALSVWLDASLLFDVDGRFLQKYLSKASAAMEEAETRGALAGGGRTASMRQITRMLDQLGLLAPDGFHPDDKGYELVVTRVLLPAFALAPSLAQAAGLVPETTPAIDVRGPRARQAIALAARLARRGYDVRPDLQRSDKPWVPHAGARHDAAGQPAKPAASSGLASRAVTAATRAAALLPHRGTALRA